MFCQFQKTAYYVYFGTMREKNVLSVPKNGVLRLFWDYEGKNVLSVPKKTVNCCFLELHEKNSYGKSHPKV